MLKISKKEEKIRFNLYKKTNLNLTKKILKPILIKLVSLKTRQYLQQIMNNFQNKKNYTQIKTICILTGRSRSVYRFFRLSRLKIREYIKNGYFVGLKKAQW